MICPIAAWYIDFTNTKSSTLIMHESFAWNGKALGKDVTR